MEGVPCIAAGSCDVQGSAVCSEEQNGLGSNVVDVGTNGGGSGLYTRRGWFDVAYSSRKLRDCLYLVSLRREPLRRKCRLGGLQR